MIFVIPFDLLDLETLDCLFSEQNFDIVYHLAANSDIQQGYEDINVDSEITKEVSKDVAVDISENSEDNRE